MRKSRTWKAKPVPEDYRVDVLVPVFNHEKSLAICLNSILSQSHRNVFVTVIDDRSTDQSWDIAKSFEARFPGRLVLKRTKQNRGSGSLARAECGFLPSGEFWAIIEGDDWWVSDSKISAQIDFLHRNPLAAGCSGTTLQADANGLEISRIAPAKENWDYLDWLAGEPSLYVHVSSIVWKNIFSGKEGFLPHLLNRDWPRGEWALTLACLAESGKRLGHLSEVVSQYNFTGQGVWSSLDAASRDEKNQALEARLREVTPVRYRLQVIWREKRSFLNMRRRP